jgi:2-phosphoglycerate kinase
MQDAKVILVGGAPGAGKSTLAQELARRLHITSISIDDLALATQGVTTPISHPGLHLMRTGDHLTYFTSNPPERLISDASEQHDALWPAIERVIRAHAKWREPIVIEGWALRPNRVLELGLANVSSYWLVVEPSVLEEREKKNVEFVRGSEDPERMLSNFLARSGWYNDLIRDQASSLGLPILYQAGDSSVEALCNKIVWK